MARIYVSSTFRDLSQERLAARDAILTLEHLPRCAENDAADEARPLDHCVEDVRSCQGYIGIFAWRYGFVPPSCEKSITHLEYEEAGRCGIPRMIFLLREDAPWPEERNDGDPRTAKLRNELRLTRGWREFSTPDELRAEVAAAVAKRFGSGRPIPKLLPYLCDRSMQEFELGEALAGGPENRPFVAVVHGDEYQCHDMFLERLLEVSLPKILDFGEGLVAPYLLQWPTGCSTIDQLQKRLRINLGEAVCNQRSATLADIQRALDCNLAPVVVRTHLLSSDFLRLGTAIFDAFFDLWKSCSDLGFGRRLIILLFLQYEIKTGSPVEKRAAFEQLNTSLRSFLAGDLFSERLPGVAIPELMAVERSDVETWARKEVPRELFREQLLPDIRRLFECWESESKSSEIPMEALAGHLRELLYAYNSHQEIA